MVSLIVVILVEGMRYPYRYFGIFDAVLHKTLCNTHPKAEEGEIYASKQNAQSMPNHGKMILGDEPVELTDHGIKIRKRFPVLQVGETIIADNTINFVLRVREDLRVSYHDQNEYHKYGVCLINLSH